MQISHESLIKKSQENIWLKRGGVMFTEDPFAEYDYKYSFADCENVKELEKCIKESTAIRSGCIYKNLAFVNQVNGGDEWWTLKQFDGKLVGFESITFDGFIKRGEFEDLIDRLERATESQAKNLEY